MEGNNFLKLSEIVKRLRKECPWDREQTHDSLKYLMIEECYEAVDSINKKDYNHLREELGDLLLHILLQAEISEENKEFDLNSVIEMLSEKLIRRHPHIFNTEIFISKDEQIKTWDKIKIEEGKLSVLSGLPKILPSLYLSQRIQEKVAKVGFDWENKSDVLKKIKEEIAELENAISNNDEINIKEEIGDLIFSIVNLSRHYKINSEEALSETNIKFTKRFNFIEKEMERNNKNIYESNLNELDELWNKSKTNS